MERGLVQKRRGGKRKALRPKMYNQIETRPLETQQQWGRLNPHSISSTCTFSMNNGFLVLHGDVKVVQKTKIKTIKKNDKKGEREIYKVSE